VDRWPIMVLSIRQVPHRLFAVAFRIPAGLATIAAWLPGRPRAGHRTGTRPSL